MTGTFKRKNETNQCNVRKHRVFIKRDETIENHYSIISQTNMSITAIETNTILESMLAYPSVLSSQMEELGEKLMMKITKLEFFF